jgi:O-antigen biosynthesis protein
MAETRTRRKAPSARSRSAPTVRRAAELAPEIAIVLLGSPSGTAAGVPTVELARLTNGAASSEAVELRLASGRRLELPAEKWEEVSGELKGLIRDELAPLDAQSREAILATLAGATGLDGQASFELSRSLHAIREVLRERLPRCAVSEDQPFGLAIEEVLRIDDSTFWINGWVHDEDGRGEVRVVSPEGARASLTEAAYRYARPDVVQFYAGLGGDRGRKHGFTSCVSLPAASRLTEDWIAELRTSDGIEVEIQCPTAVSEPLAVRARILGELGSKGAVGGELAERHGRPALTRLQERIVAESEVDSVDVYGDPPATPAVSIVVPLYKRLDFLEHQLLQFSRDPDFAEVELIYVLDSTEQKEELTKQAQQLFALYGLPFRVVNPTAGAGFAGANNHGIGLAQADRLLLLNSDVIPDRPGWIGAMGEFYERTPKIGALGPKLLYEDDSLQHAGLYFHREPGSRLWSNAHCFKGMHRTFPAANVARPVPAVTAACMMIDRELYEEAGGLPLHYVQGDYEDSELCLRLAEAGRENWYLPSVELYHLEGQSYVAAARRVPSEYNMWLHSSLWGERIAELMAEFDPNAPEGEQIDLQPGRGRTVESS